MIRLSCSQWESWTVPSRYDRSLTSLKAHWSKFLSCPLYTVGSFDAWPMVATIWATQSTCLAAPYTHRSHSLSVPSQWSRATFGISLQGHTSPWTNCLVRALLRTICCGTLYGPWRSFHSGLWGMAHASIACSWTADRTLKVFGGKAHRHLLCWRRRPCQSWILVVHPWKIYGPGLCGSRARLYHGDASEEIAHEIETFSFVFLHGQNCHFTSASVCVLTFGSNLSSC